jgi:hypothetical protein
MMMMMIRSVEEAAEYVARETEYPENTCPNAAAVIILRASSLDLALGWL